MFEVVVAWDTAGRAANVPEYQVGAAVHYFSARYSNQTVKWFQGYVGEDNVFVESTTGTSTICVALERHEPVDHGRWGCGECSDEEHTTMTMQQCKDVVLGEEYPPEEDLPRVTFDFAIAP